MNEVLQGRAYLVLPRRLANLARLSLGVLPAGRSLAVLALILATGPLSALAAPAVVVAQGNDEWTPGPVGCAIAAQILLHPPGADRYATVLNRTSYCPDGVEMFVSAWEAAPADGERLDLLAFHSSRLADHRIFNAVLAVFVDPARGVPQRRAALKAVVKLVSPRSWIYDDIWAKPARSSIPTMTHTWQTAGPIPLSTADRARAATAVRSASVSDADPGIRAVSAWLRRELPAEFGDACSGAALKPDSSSTAWLCVPTP